MLAASVITRRGETLMLSTDAPHDVLEALRAGIASQRERLDRERFVRAHVLGGMIGCDPKMQLVFEAIRQVCRLDVPVLVTGETGSGKELVARAIHELSPRRGGAFEAVNCGAIAASLFESQVFGHARGAFTGAVRDHEGIFERCDGGTAFLDEIGELEAASQAKLLRVLQHRTFQRVGEAVTRTSAFRLVAATHRDLPSMIAAGLFREDLFYRCNVFSIRVPSLRERADDLPWIVEDLLAASCARIGIERPSVVSDGAMARLRAHRWPGNVRELENVLIRAAIAAKGAPIQSAHLELDGASSVTPPASNDTSRTLAEVERQYVIAVLTDTGWNVRVAAKRLGIARASLYRKVRDYGLVRPSAQEDVDE
jgi:DNA-binding NtrC family response regulator